MFRIKYINFRELDRIETFRSIESDLYRDRREKLSDHLNHVVSTVRAIIIIPEDPPQPSSWLSSRRDTWSGRLRPIEITASSERRYWPSRGCSYLSCTSDPAERKRRRGAFFCKRRQTCPAVFTIRPGLWPRRRKFRVIAVVTGSLFTSALRRAFTAPSRHIRVARVVERTSSTRGLLTMTWYTLRAMILLHGIDFEWLK